MESPETTIAGPTVEQPISLCVSCRHERLGGCVDESVFGQTREHVVGLLVAESHDVDQVLGADRFPDELGSRNPKQGAIIDGKIGGGFGKRPVYVREREREWIGCHSVSFVCWVDG